MKLMGYYTTANAAKFKSDNPKSAYINLSLIHNWIRTTVVINGQFINIPRWLLLDHLSIGQILDPERRSVRHSKDRLTVQPELTNMLASRGFRMGEGMNTYIPKLRLDVKEVTKLKYADTVRQELQDNSITHSDVVKKIMVSFFDIRPDYSCNNDAVSACIVTNGWNWFEFHAAWSLYHQKDSRWTAPNDPAGV